MYTEKHLCFFLKIVLHVVCADHKHTVEWSQNIGDMAEIILGLLKPIWWPVLMSENIYLDA